VALNTINVNLKQQNLSTATQEGQKLNFPEENGALFHETGTSFLTNLSISSAASQIDNV